MIHLLIAGCIVILAGCKGAARNDRPDENDSLSARQEIAYTDPFGIFSRQDTVTETIPDSIEKTYSDKEYEAIQDSIWKRRKALETMNPKDPLVLNIIGSGIGNNGIRVDLSVNTPYWRQQFREKILNSPAIHFRGPEHPEEIEISNLADAAVQDSLGIFLQPEYSVFPIDGNNNHMMLYNRAGAMIWFGADYIIGYQGPDGKWYYLPGLENWTGEGYGVDNDNEGYKLDIQLLPELNRIRPGVFRYYKSIDIEERPQPTVFLVSEFRVTDNPEELKQAKKLDAPAKNNKGSFAPRVLYQ